MNPRTQFALLVAGGIGILAGIALMTWMTIWVSRVRQSGVSDLEPVPATMTVGKLVNFCRKCDTDTPCREANQIAIGYCRGFVAGVLGSRADLRLCLPKDWDTGKALRLFQIWAEQHPEKKPNSAADEIMQAHAAAFDCRKVGHGI